MEKAYYTLRDFVYLEPILPDGDSIVDTVSNKVVIMREAIRLQQYDAESRGRGRPPYAISRKQLVFLLEHGFTQCAIAKLRGCSARTSNCRISNFQLQSYFSFSDMEDQFLDLVVQDVQRQYPSWREESIHGHPHSAGVQRWHICESLLCVCPSTVKEHFRQTIRRREFRVPYPNSLRHIDGYHKLIKWKIVMHGGVDGYSWIPVYMAASDNKKTTRVLDAFEGTVRKYRV